MEGNALVSALGAILAGVGVALLFSLAVFIHELGHFLAARWMGMTIDVFSVGFGPAIWKRKIGETEYRISWIPLGGYVALPQLDPSGMDLIQGSREGGEAEDEGSVIPADAGTAAADAAPPARRLADIAPWRRMIVAAAGPTGNLVLAVFLAWVVYLAPDSGAGGAGTTVGFVGEESAAYASGLRAGDLFISVNQNRVNNWNEFLVECHLGGDVSNGLAAVVRRDGKVLDLHIPVKREPEGGLVRIDGIGPLIPCVVGALTTNSPAEKAGLLPGDVVLRLDGWLLASYKDMMERVNEAGERPVILTIVRKGREIEVAMTPRFDAESGRHLVGIAFDGRAGYAPQWMQYRNPWMQLKNDASGVIRILRALFAPRVKGEAGRAASGLSGPLVIFVLLWYQVRQGLIVSLAFLRFLCVNLALLNLLPLPVLDGGHIVFALYESVTRRKPNASFVNALSNVFAVLLLGLMALLLFRDAFSLGRIFGWRRNDGGAAATAPALAEDANTAAEAIVAIPAATGETGADVAPAGGTEP